MDSINVSKVKISKTLLDFLKAGGQRELERGEIIETQILGEMTEITMTEEMVRGIGITRETDDMREMIETIGMIGMIEEEQKDKKTKK